MMLLFGCAQNNRENQFMAQFYSKKEIAELDQLAQFIKNEISGNCIKTPEECFDHYFDQFKSLGANEEVDLEISKKSEQSFLANFDKSLFQDIWIFCDGQRSVGEDSLINVRRLCINPKGRFASFLLKLTENHNQLNAYGETFKYTGDYTPSMNMLVLKQPEKIDFQSKDEFLLLTVQLLTLNYPEEIYLD
ncbi:hypothetical protein [Echinicola sp. 20G]|uniref:hypothetical protein n=1 Tax=Echinicola sp. 20G TaxID=2781961 RepID=UPI001910C84A|nr:hypothetical protein [Echinicola sp. 20G]